MAKYIVHYGVSDRPIFTGEQGKLFVELFNDERFKTLAHLHYCEGKTLLRCSELMNYSKKHIERLHVELKDIAIKELMKLVGSEINNSRKLLQIKNIIEG